MQPVATYSATLARHSSGVPDAVISCTTSSGTSFDAVTTSSCVAGHVSTWPISSSSSSGTPEAFMMCGCWPEVLRHEQAGGVERRVAVVVHRAHHELRPVDVVERAPHARGTLGQCGERTLVVRRRHEVVEERAVADLARQLHHLQTGGADHDRHLLGSSLLVHVVELDAVEVHELAVERHGLVGEQRAHDGDVSRAWPATACRG